MNKVLLIQTASIGDVILATPLLENLHRKFPDADIDILLKKGNEQLFEAHPFLHEALLWDKSNRKHRNLLQILHYIRNRRYDLIVNIQRFLSTGLLTVFSGAKITTGFKKNPVSMFFTHRLPHVFGENIHEIDRNLSLVGWLVKTPERNIKLYPSPTDEKHVKHYRLENYITISPASLWFTKQFPLEQWIKFLQQLPKHLTVYLLGSKTDVALCDNIIREVNDVQIKNLAGQLTLLQSASLMQSARMNFVNDSASMHLCSATNAPVTAIFCSTVPIFGFGPLSDTSFIVENHENLPCRPCGIHGHKTCPKQHFKCAYNITIQELLIHL
jgi:heptosyltransferase-2